MGIDYAAIGGRVKEYRKKKGLTQEKLAELIDISIPHMSNIETGKTKFSLVILFALVEVLDVTADMLLMGRAGGGKDKLHSLVLKEVDELLAGCSDVQVQLIVDSARSTKKVLTQYGLKEDGEA